MTLYFEGSASRPKLYVPSGCLISSAVIRFASPKSTSIALRIAVSRSIAASKDTFTVPEILIFSPDAFVWADVPFSANGSQIYFIRFLYSASSFNTSSSSHAPRLSADLSYTVLERSSTIMPSPVSLIGNVSASHPFGGHVSDAIHTDWSLPLSTRTAGSFSIPLSTPFR